MKKFFIIAAAMLVAAIVVTSCESAYAQTTENVNYTWTAPTSGSPVHHYIVNWSTNGGTTWTAVGGTSVTTTAYTLAATIGLPNIIRIAGVDASSRQGPWSVSSVAYTPLGPPGQPGQPVLVP